MKRAQHNMSLPLSLPPAVLPDNVAWGSAAPCSQSALRIARDAMARWRGAPLPAGALARDHIRMSPQARWIAEAHAGLSMWIARGGFAQSEEAAAALPAPRDRPVIYWLPITGRAIVSTSPEHACRLS